MEKQLYTALSAIVKEDRIACNVPLRDYTTFGVGGPAAVLVRIASVSELQKVVKLLKAEAVPYFMIGKGSNLLVSDEGYEGVVLCPDEEMCRVQCEGTVIRAGAGASLARVAALALQEELTGFEFAAGIPGTVGGAMVMNAGAYDGEMKQVVTLVSLLDEDGECLELTAEEMEFGYRTSILKRKDYLVTEVLFTLKKGTAAQIKEKMKDLAYRRMEKQPLEYPSAGSTFKRPEGDYAGRLIGAAGLSGYTIGGAQVSEKHNGFIINKGDAAAADIKALIAYVQKRVEETSGICLEPEVIYVGKE